MKDERTETIPPQSPLQIFLRFLRFGLLAWGGPMAQIAMIRQELVDEERWVSSERFNRVLAVYQVLPGPEAHEMCVYFGMRAGKRWGGFLAGAGFMLPGLVLMLVLSWFYVAYGITSPLFAGIFYGFQPAVAALIIRAVHRIGAHAVVNRWLFAIALASALASFLRLHFVIVLLFAGGAYVLVMKNQYRFAVAVIALLFLSSGSWFYFAVLHEQLPREMALTFSSPPPVTSLFGSGLRTGLLTFGGAYTAIPFLQNDAVASGGWMTNNQFLDGLALGGILPAPLIIFGTFVGYLGGGFAGALALTFGIFLPAFAFTLVGHEYIEHVIERKGLHAFLDGVTAGVVGLIAATAVELFRAAVPDLPSLVLFAAALFLLYRWKAKYAVALVMLGAGLAGFLLSR